MKWIVSLPVTVCTALAGWYMGGRMLPEQVGQTTEQGAVAGAAPVVAQTTGGEGVATRTGSVAELAIEAQKRLKSYSEAQIVVFGAVEKMSAAELKNEVVRSAQGGRYGLVSRDLAGYWAEVDLPSARDFLMGLNDKDREFFAPEICRTWAAQDPAGLLDWLDSLPPEVRLKVGAKLVDVLGAVAGRKAPERVNAILLSLPSKDDKGGDYASLYTTWADRDPKTAATQALALPTSTSRVAAVSAVARAWAEKDPVAARAWVEGLDDGILGANAQAAFARGLAQKDPQAAAEYLGGMALTKDNEKAYAEVLGGWVTRDPVAAWKFADAQTDETARGEVYRHMFLALADNNLALAAKEYLARQKDLPRGSAALSIISDRMADSGIVAMQAFGDQLEPEAARSFYLTSFYRWGANHRAEAEEWAWKQPEGPGREIGLRYISTQLVGRSLPEIQAWEAKLAVSPSSDAAMRNVGLLYLQNKEPNLAIGLSKRLSSPEVQQRLLVDWFSTWLRVDPAKAGAWIRKSDQLPAEVRAQLNLGEEQ